MFLSSKILSKFTPKLNKLHLTTITLFKANFNKIYSKLHHLQGRPQDLGGGGPRKFFFRFGNLHVAKRHAVHGEAMRIARGVRGHAPPRKFFKTVQFGAF